MDSIISAIGDGLSGGVLGVIGGLGTSILKYFTQKSEQNFKLQEKKDKRKHDLNMITATTKATVIEIEANVQRDQIMMDGQADIEESKGRNGAILKLSENYVKIDLVDFTGQLTIVVALDKS